MNQIEIIVNVKDYSLPQLSNKYIEERLVEIQTDHLSQDPYGRRAAVLVPILQNGDSWELLFTRRSDLVNDHKGQVSFPGGSVEVSDATIEQAALREAQEEIGLPAHSVHVLGRLLDYPSISGYCISPIIGKIQYPFQLNLNKFEVSRVFTVPISWLANCDNFELKLYPRPDGTLERLYFYHEYKGELIWGISAKITIQLMDRLDLLQGCELQK